MNTQTAFAPVARRLWTRSTLFLLALVALSAALVVRRFALGLGATTALSDGYPWGLWIAFDVVTGTALGCGGFAIALLVYVLNRGQYHPLLRPAIVTSALGYSIAGASVMLDLGRPWVAWKLPFFVGDWNHDSVLLEVALCIMAYSAVLWIELAPAALERAEASSSPALARGAAAWKPRLQRALLWISALGLLLPTMHQSSLGSLMLLSGPRLHPLWNTLCLPLLFLISCVGMGFGAVVIESTLSARAFGRPAHLEMLAGLGGAMLPIGALYLLIRAADWVVRGQLGALFAFDLPSAMTLLELALFAAALFLLRDRARRRDPGNLFRAAMLFLLAGALYRIDVFLLAFRPGAHWTYFPSVAELLVTIGLVAGEIAAYILLVKTFPILSGRSQAAPDPLPRSVR